MWEKRSSSKTLKRQNPGRVKTSKLSLSLSSYFSLSFLTLLLSLSRSLFPIAFSHCKNASKEWTASFSSSCCFPIFLLRLLPPSCAPRFVCFLACLPLQFLPLTLSFAFFHLLFILLLRLFLPSPAILYKVSFCCDRWRYLWPHRLLHGIRKPSGPAKLAHSIEMMSHKILVPCVTPLDQAYLGSLVPALVLSPSAESRASSALFFPVPWPVLSPLVSRRSDSLC